MRVYDPEVYDAMSHLALRKDKTIRMVEQNEIMHGFRFYSAMLDISGLPCVEGPDMGVVWDKPHKDDIALISNSDATKRSVTRPRSPVWNNYLRMAAVIKEAMDKDTKVQ